MIQNFEKYLEITHSRPYMLLHEYYQKESIWEITGTARLELPHSNFISWVLDNGSAHGLGEEPFRRFVESLCLVNEKWYGGDIHSKYKQNIFNHSSGKYYEQLMVGKYAIEQMNVIREKSLSNGRRADIFIVVKLIFSPQDYKFLIVCIENKVGSPEKEEDINGKVEYQTEIYEKFLTDSDKIVQTVSNITETGEDEFSEDDILLLPVFMIAKPSQAIEKNIGDASKLVKSDYVPASREFITYNYQHFLDDVISPIIERGGSEAERHFIEYRRCLGPQSQSFLDDSGDKIKGDFVMAVSQNEKEWALGLLSKDGDCEESVKVIEEIFDSLKKDSFLLQDRETPFWVELAKLYCHLDEIGYKIPLDMDTVKRAAKVSNEKKYYYIGEKQYKNKGKSRNSLGYLVFDLISLYAKKNTGCSLSPREIIENVWGNKYKFMFLTKDEYDVSDRKDDYFDEQLEIGGEKVFLWKWWVQWEVDIFIEKLDMSAEVQSE